MTSRNGFHRADPFVADAGLALQLAFQLSLVPRH